MSEGKYLENTQSITEMLRAMQELKQRIQSQKAQHLEQLKNKAIGLQKQIDEANRGLAEVIEMLKALQATPDELAGFPPLILSAFTVKARKGRASVIYNGQPMSAAAVCRILYEKTQDKALIVGKNSAVRVLEGYLKTHPLDNVKIL